MESCTWCYIFDSDCWRKCWYGRLFYLFLLQSNIWIICSFYFDFKSSYHTWKNYSNEAMISGPLWKGSKSQDCMNVLFKDKKRFYCSLRQFSLLNNGTWDCKLMKCSIDRHSFERRSNCSSSSSSFSLRSYTMQFR